MDASEPPNPTQPSTTASSSPPSPASIRCLRQRANGSRRLHRLLIQSQRDRNTCRGWRSVGFSDFCLMHLTVTF